MNTPKEEADRIYYMFTFHAPTHKENKQCALICVGEIIEMLNYNDPQDSSYYFMGVKEFYLEVKQILESK